MGVIQGIIKGGNYMIETASKVTRDIPNYRQIAIDKFGGEVITDTSLIIKAYIAMVYILGGVLITIIPIIYYYYTVNSYVKKGKKKGIIRFIILTITYIPIGYTLFAEVMGNIMNNMPGLVIPFGVILSISFTFVLVLVRSLTLRMTNTDDPECQHINYYMLSAKLLGVSIVIYNIYLVYVYTKHMM